MLPITLHSRRSCSRRSSSVQLDHVVSTPRCSINGTWRGCPSSRRSRPAASPAPSSAAVCRKPARPPRLGSAHDGRRHPGSAPVSVHRGNSHGARRRGDDGRVRHRRIWRRADMTERTLPNCRAQASAPASRRIRRSRARRDRSDAHRIDEGQRCIALASAMAICILISGTLDDRLLLDRPGDARVEA